MLSGKVSISANKMVYAEGTILWWGLCIPSFRTIAMFTAWKLSKYGVFSGPYFPVFGQNTGKYGSEKTPYMDTSHTVKSFLSYYSKLLK